MGSYSETWRSRVGQSLGDGLKGRVAHVRAGPVAEDKQVAGAAGRISRPETSPFSGVAWNFISSVLTAIATAPQDVN